ncbi:P-loop NTPase fold protein [Agromyces sp. NPDC058126]|uniref:KAP family P-loop NTPase fold protein n=1 Tax=Agromyces sp. NPDC058126 TaxID=3346350 RepID=UPI0036DE12A4
MSDAEPRGFWTDEPIDAPTDDRFGRASFARMIARRVDETAPNQSSTVFGVVGEWGAGKSSILNMIRSAVASDWKVVSFSPWAASSAEGLSQQFLAALRNAFDELPQSENITKVKEVTAKYGRAATPWLKFVPVVGDALASVADHALDVTAGSIPSWDRSFQDLSKAMKNLGHRVLIVADDIDRLDSTELLELLKVVRLLGRFPNVHYLLAYDQASVEALLAERGFGGRASAFMEKIVQYPYELPALSEVSKRRLLSESLELMYSRADHSNSAEEISRASELLGVLAPSLETPRSHIRFREQLLSVVTLVDVSEIDLLDLAAATYLRIFAHDLYLSIPEWHARLRTGKWRRKLIDDADLTAEDWHDWVTRHVRFSQVDHVMKVLSFLFPTVHVGGLSYHEQHPRGLADEKYVQRYFVLGIPDDDVSDVLVERALSCLEGGEPDGQPLVELTAVLDDGDDQRSALAAEKAMASRLRSSKPSIAIVRFVFDRMTKKTDTLSFLSAGAVLGRWFVREAFDVLDCGALTAAEACEWFGDGYAIALAQRILQNPNFDDDARRQIGESLLDQLDSSLAEKLADPESLQGLLGRYLHLRRRVRGPGSLLGILDESLTAVDEQSLAIIAAEFVEVWTTAGVEDSELKFELDHWREVVSDDLTRASLTSVSRLGRATEMNDTDPGPENVRAFALTSLLIAFPPTAEDNP